MKLRHNYFSRLLLFFLIISIAPLKTYAASSTVTPQASYYLTSYRAYTKDVGNGNFEIWFNVTGTTRMDELGALSIAVYESTDNVNWNYRRTFRHTDFPQFLGHNEIFYQSHITYCLAHRNYYYKAIVCIWGGKDGNGDRRYYETTPFKST